MTAARLASRLLGPATLQWRVLLALLIALVCVLALSPAPPQAVQLSWDKLNHALAFAALGFCAALGWRSPGWLRAVVLAGLLAFGALIELLQLWVPNRAGEWGDLLADAVGIGLGALLAVALLRLRAGSAAQRR